MHCQQNLHEELRKSLTSAAQELPLLLALTPVAASDAVDALIQSRCQRRRPSAALKSHLWAASSFASPGRQLSSVFPAGKRSVLVIGLWRQKSKPEVEEWLIQPYRVGRHSRILSPTWVACLWPRCWAAAPCASCPWAPPAAAARWLPAPAAERLSPPCRIQSFSVEHRSATITWTRYMKLIGTNR